MNLTQVLKTLAAPRKHWGRVLCCAVDFTMILSGSEEFELESWHIVKKCYDVGHSEFPLPTGALKCLKLWENSAMKWELMERFSVNDPMVHCKFYTPCQCFFLDLGAFQFDNGSCGSCDQQEVPRGLMKLVKPAVFWGLENSDAQIPHLGGRDHGLPKNKNGFSSFFNGNFLISHGPT